MYMNINHRPSCHVTAPVKFHMSDSPAVCKLKATVFNMVKYESTERLTMDEVKEVVDGARGKLIVLEKISDYPTISRTLQVDGGSFTSTNAQHVNPSYICWMCIFRCINPLSLN